MDVYRGVCIIGCPWLPLVVAPSNQQFSGVIIGNLMFEAYFDLSYPL